METILYDRSRGSGYSGSYAAPGTTNSGSAERRAEAEEVGAAGGSPSAGPGGEEEEHAGGILPIVAMDTCPCSPALLFRDGDVYEEEEDEEEGEGGLTLVRRDGKVVEGGRGGAAAAEGGVFSELLSADELACDVGGLDSQLEDIVRRVLSTRSLPAEVRRGLIVLCLPVLQIPFQVK